MDIALYVEWNGGCGEDKKGEDSLTSTRHINRLWRCPLIDINVSECRGLGVTYAKGWLIMVGASRTLPVPGNGIRRRHARLRILPRLGALRGDNTPTAALQGLRMITMAKCLHGCSLSCFLQVGEGKASSLLPGLSGLSSSLGNNPLHGCPGGFI